MPVKITKTSKGYTVSTPGGAKGRNMTKANAIKQEHILNAVDHGWKPTHKK